MGWRGKTTPSSTRGRLMYRCVGHGFPSMEISVPRNGITVVRLIATGERAAVTRDGIESLENDDAGERLVVAVCVCSRHDVVFGDRGGEVSKEGECVFCSNPNVQCCGSCQCS
jgi:hypothetical protein